MDVIFNNAGKYRINRDLIEVTVDDVINKKVFQIHDEVAKEYISVGHVILAVVNFVKKEVKEVESFVKKEEEIITTKMQSKKGK